VKEGGKAEEPERRVATGEQALQHDAPGVKAMMKQLLLSLQNDAQGM
jgi:hypothetical protein